jgi:CrcB protein
MTQGSPAPGVFPPVRRSRLPRIHRRLVAAVAVGGFAGGVLRYAVGLQLPASATGFPWAIFTVNTAGAFLLALLLVLVLEVLPPTTYLRPLIGTGFCGALTTFSSVATGVDQLIARDRPGVAAGYLAANLAAGVVAALGGTALGRSAAALKRRDLNRRDLKQRDLKRRER